MLDSNFLAATFIVMLALPLAAGLVGLFGKNSLVANAVVGIMNMVGSAIGAAGAAAFLYLNARGTGGDAIAPGRLLPVLPPGFLNVDTLAACFLLMINLGVFLAAWYAIVYLPRCQKIYRFPWLHAATAFFVFGMLLAVMSNTPLVFLFAWEIMSFAAYFLLVAERSEEAVRGAFPYVCTTAIGAAALISGFAIVTGGNFSLPLGVLVGAKTEGVALLGVSLLLAGFAAKAGIFPFHEWLPEPYPHAPANVAALTSGVTLKVALYGFLRVLFAFHFALPLPLIFVVLGLSLFTAVYGALMAAVETDLKKALAWSSVENMGLMMAMAGAVALLISVGAIAAANAVLLALLVQAFGHMLFKSGLFMAAGALVAETETRNLNRMGGLAKKWPLFSGVFLVLAVVAAALPPGSGFYAEWVFLQSLASTVAYGPVVGLVVVIVVSLFTLAAGLAVFAMVKIFAAVFLGRARSAEVEQVKAVPFALYAPAAAAAALAVLLGLALPYFLRGIFGSAASAVVSGPMMIADGASVSPLAVALLVLGVAALLFFVRRIFLSRRLRLTETWDCGAPISPRMEYTATGFSAPIRFFFRALTLPWKRIVSLPAAPGNPWIAVKKYEHGWDGFAGRYLYRPFGKLLDQTAARVKRLQSGVVQFYLALIFVALVITLIVAL